MPGSEFSRPSRPLRRPTPTMALQTNSFDESERWWGDLLGTWLPARLWYDESDRWSTTSSGAYGIRTIWTIVGIHIIACYCPSAQHCESQVSRVHDSHLWDNNSDIRLRQPINTLFIAYCNLSYGIGGISQICLISQHMHLLVFLWPSFKFACCLASFRSKLICLLFPLFSVATFSRYRFIDRDQWPSRRACNLISESQINLLRDATSTPLGIPTIFLLSRTRAGITNAIGPDAQTCNGDDEDIWALQRNEVTVTTTDLIAKSTQLGLCSFILLVGSIGSQCLVKHIMGNVRRFNKM